MFDVKWMAVGWVLSIVICIVAIQPMPISDGWKEFIATPIVWGMALGFGAYARGREEKACRRRAAAVHKQLRAVHGDDVPRVFP